MERRLGVLIQENNLHAEAQQSGRHFIRLDASILPSGVVYCRTMKGTDTLQMRKILLVR